MLQDLPDRRPPGDELNRTVVLSQSRRFKKQVEFILEIDKLKHILRQTPLVDGSRRENSAEHSWHIALMVPLLSEYADDPKMDFSRVMKMLLVHDLVEIDAGDTYCYDDEGRRDKLQREESAADRIFAILPPDLAQPMRALWDEFEARKTPESRFANALDRLQPFLHNCFTRGQSWRQHGVKSSQVVSRMRPVKDGSEQLWKYALEMIEEAVKKGYLAR